MGGEGSMLHMLLSYRNNRKLLRKKSIFEKQKSFSEAGTMHDSLHKELEIRHLSQEELEQIRKETLQARKRYNLLRLSLGILILLIVTGSALLLRPKIKAHFLQKATHKEQALESRKNEYYAIYIERAKKYSAKNDYAEAMYELKKAILIFPDKPEANLLLADAYVKVCITQQLYCNRGINFISELMLKYPDNLKLLELRALLYMSMGEIEKAGTDYETLSSQN